MAGFIQETIPTQSPKVLTDFRHALCIGETGCGKTTSFMLPNIADRIKAGHGMLIMDFKGNLHEQVKVLAEQQNRLIDVVEIGVPWGTSINLFQNMSRTLYLDTLDMIHGSDKERFWISSALNLAGQVYDLFAILENIKDIIGDKDIRSFPYSFNAVSINKAFAGFSSFKSFLYDAQSIVRMLRMERLGVLMQNGMSEHDLRLVYQFSKEFSTILSNLDSFYKEIDEDSPASGSGGVFFMFRSLMLTFSQTGLDGDADVRSLLEDGKIVILRSEAYSSNLTLAMMNIIYKQLLIRNNERPISLFIDEFQRTVANKNIPYVDLFREMKVELIAAMQNIKQLENKLGVSETDEFLGNVLHNYTYADHLDNSLQTFEYIFKNKKSKAEPLFINEKEIIKAQIKWQRITKNTLSKEWVFFRQQGHKRAVIKNVKTGERKFYYFLTSVEDNFDIDFTLFANAKKVDKLAS